MSPRQHFLQPVLRRGAGPHRLVVAGSNRQVASAIEVAGDSASRKKGLLGRSSLAEGTAFVIAPCSAVHTFGMQFPIDVIYVARDGRVVKVTERLGRSRVSAALGAFAAIEMAAGAAGRVGLEAGDVLAVTAGPSSGMVL